MSRSSRLSEESSLEELVQDHLLRLTEILNNDQSFAELEREVTVLNELIYSYKLRDDLLKCLLDNSAPSRKRNEIRELLKAVHVTVAGDKAEIERLHAKSQQLIQLSIKLIGRGQKRIDEHAHQLSGYALEKCAICDALGRVEDEVCPACRGKCVVLVNRPIEPTSSTLLK